MAVREADGDSASYFRAKPDIEAPPNGQAAFSSMTDGQLRFFVAESTKWQDSKVPDTFDPWNSWGGEHTARAMAKGNAENAQRELDRRAEQ